MNIWIIGKLFAGVDPLQALQDEFPRTAQWQDSGEKLTTRLSLGRDDQGRPLGANLVNETIYVQVATTPGVRSIGRSYGAPEGAVPQVWMGTAEVDDATVAQAIHATASRLVLAAQGIPGWEPDDPFTTPRWTEIRAGLIALGMTAAQVDNWWGAGGKTPRELVEALLKLWGG